MSDNMTESDYAPIEKRRVLRVVDSKMGFVYDTESASCLWREERISSERAFHGVALYLNIYDTYFLHRYHQWDRFNGIQVVTIQEAIQHTAQHCPNKVEEIFGKLHEDGEGPAFTPKAYGF
jgi:hypothetical protein